jgi:hypothetical protein
LTLKSQPFFDQGLEGFAALLAGLRLRLRHGAKAR